MIQLYFNEAASHEVVHKKEWLETNGLGGWAGSSLSGCATRRYHGLLVAAVHPPAGRMVLVSKMDETIVSGDRRLELGTNQYGSVIHPQGYRYLRAFRKDLFSEFVFEAEGVVLRKSILMVYEENSTVIRYEVEKAPSAFTLELLPLLAVRDYHGLVHANDAVRRKVEEEGEGINVRLYEGTPALYIHVPGSIFQARPDWYYRFHYAVEEYRGQDADEDLFSPGFFTCPLKQGDAVHIILSTEGRHRDGASLFRKEVNRRAALLESCPDHPLLRSLVLAADQFIVRKGEDLKTVIAGYHWFGDWSRDTMIALPGLCLSTGRFADAKKILAAFAQWVDRGMLPNRFGDGGEPLEFNTVDGTLHYFIAVYRYLHQTGDRAFVLEHLLPVLGEIIQWHIRGTRYNIHVTDDGLLFAGQEGCQLTWMDARIGHRVVTPRIGKAVEVQALWYNALMIYGELLSWNGQEEEAARALSRAEKAKDSFLPQFWNAAGGCLYDVIGPDGAGDPSLRPNQLLAISLPFPLLEGARAKAVAEVVSRKLYTPKGLRSLSPDEAAYVPNYGGDAEHRDAAYHQGTVWSWLLGPYIDALFRTSDPVAARDRADQVIQDFVPHLSEGCIGSVSEIFDAEAPFKPRGCVAQAWGVGEVLRVIQTYQLYDGSKSAPPKPLEND